MTEEELQKWVEALSLCHFGIPFRHRARWNGRLRTTAGRYSLRDHEIQLNPRYLEEHGPRVMERIILHELCHYHLHLAGKGYRHRDPDFRRLLADVGGLRYAPPLSFGKSAKLYVFVCRSCGKKYGRKRNLNVRRYACGQCGGPIARVEHDPDGKGP
jgi:SprT-like protein